MRQTWGVQSQEIEHGIEKGVRRSIDTETDSRRACSRLRLFSMPAGQPLTSAKLSSITIGVTASSRRQATTTKG